MQYKVLKFNNGTAKNGKPYKRLEIEGEDGNHNVAIFSEWPDFANITIGSTIDGTIERNGQYENIKSSVIAGRGGAYSAPRRDISKDVEKAQERTTQSVQKAQEFTSSSVKVSATWRDAVILATTEFKDKTVLDNLDQAVLKWRKFCWEHFDDPITDPLYPN